MTTDYVGPNPYALFDGLKRDRDRGVQTALPCRCKLAEGGAGEPLRDILD